MKITMFNWNNEEKVEKIFKDFGYTSGKEISCDHSLGDDNLYKHVDLLFAQNLNVSLLHSSEGIVLSCSTGRFSQR